MAQYISAEQRAKIVSAIKDEGMSIPDAAKTFMVSDKTVRKWLRNQSRNAHTSSTEVQRLHQLVLDYQLITAELMHQLKSKRKSGHQP